MDSASHHGSVAEEEVDIINSLFQDETEETEQRESTHSSRC